jgi:hypothetical protein
MSVSKKAELAVEHPETPQRGHTSPRRGQRRGVCPHSENPDPKAAPAPPSA